MKRMTLFAGALVLLLVAGMVGAVSANAIPAYADEYPLYAGQTEPAGAVYVWNDESDLHVFYDLDGWCMTESHLEVATILEGIPQTKKGNPIPGQFSYNETYDYCVDSDEFIISLEDLGVTSESNLTIAAHARVWAADSGDKTVTTCFKSAPDIAASGPLSSYAEVIDPAWGTAGTAVAAYVHPNWDVYVSSLTSDGAIWIGTETNTANPSADTWRKFSGTFDINDGYPLSGTVTATADNVEEFYLNGDLIYTDGPVNDTSPCNTYEWQTVLTNSFVPIAGTNTFDFIVRNYAKSGGTSSSNPTGLIYEICYKYSTASETAWAAQDQPLTNQFDGKNWATYFTYDVQGWESIEEVFVPATNSDGKSSLNSLTDGMLYRLDASGIYFFRTQGSANGYQADAEWALRTDYIGTTDGVDLQEGWTKGDLTYTNLQGLDLTVDDPANNIDWGDFNDAHLYSIEYTGTGTTVAFAIFDNVYTDNTGGLTVKIYQWM